MKASNVLSTECVLEGNVLFKKSKASGEMSQKKNEKTLLKRLSFLQIQQRAKRISNQIGTFNKFLTVFNNVMLLLSW